MTASSPCTYELQMNCETIAGQADVRIFFSTLLCNGCQHGRLGVQGQHPPLPGEAGTLWNALKQFRRPFFILPPALHTGLTMLQLHRLCARLLQVVLLL